MALTGEASRPLEIPPRAGEPTADTFAVSAYDPITQRRDGQTEVVNLAVSTVVDPPPPSVTAVTSGFDNLFSDNEGWDVGPKTEGRTWNNCGPAEQHPSGGNPDGYISHEEYCGSPYIFNDSWYFVAPAKFRGDRSDAYGKSLDFDLNSDYSSSWTSMDGAELVVLTGAGKFLYVTMAGRTYPGEAWTHYSVPLVAGAGVGGCPRPTC